MRKLLIPTCLIVASHCAMGVSLARGQATESKPGQVEAHLPPGWTEEDMMACVAAGTPGEKHELLAQGAGTWRGTNTMWMAPGTEPMTSECVAVVTPIMDGRFTKCEWKGDMPGMGPYKGFGIYGYDNIAQKLVSIWIDNHGTGIMTGDGELSSDKKTMTWKYTHNCPLTKEPTVMREVETITGPNTKTLEMFATDPKSGKEFKMMRVELKRTEGYAQTGRKD
jgi:hypothetical protein